MVRATQLLASILFRHFLEDPTGPPVPVGPNARPSLHARPAAQSASFRKRWYDLSCTQLVNDNRRRVLHHRFRHRPTFAPLASKQYGIHLSAHWGRTFRSRAVAARTSDTPSPALPARPAARGARIRRENDCQLVFRCMVRRCSSSTSRTHAAPALATGSAEHRAALSVTPLISHALERSNRNSPRRCRGHRRGVGSTRARRAWRGATLSSSRSVSTLPSLVGRRGARLGLPPPAVRLRRAATPISALRVAARLARTTR